VTTAEQLHQALRETDEAFDAWREARIRRAPECARLDRLAQEACARSNALREQCRKAFADSRGWRYNHKVLAYMFHHPKDQWSDSGDRFIDCHTEAYCDDQRNVVALVSHTFSTPQEMADYAARHGYKAELLPFSWRSPRFLRAVVFTLKPGSAWPVPGRHGRPTK
jgi:hypothetical protein